MTIVYGPLDLVCPTCVKPPINVEISRVWRILSQVAACPRIKIDEYLLLTY